MHVGLIVYGSLDTMSGGYLYDRKLVAHLRSQGDTVEIIPLPWRNYLLHLTDNLHFHLPPNLDILIEDELNHPSLLTANARPHPYPVISLVHNLRSSERRPAWQNVFYREVEKKYLRSVDGFIFNSTTTREVVQALVGDSQPYVIATPGGDRFGSLTPERVRARAAEPGPLRLLFLANVTPLKGLHVLLEAMAKDFSNQRSAISLDVIGSMTVDPQYAEKMRRFVSANGLSSAVCFHGVLDGEALVERLRKSQALVIPSFYEGFGIAFLEGMAFGLPAIGTTAGAVPQLITDSENGYLIAPSDAETLAKRLQGLASPDRSLLVKMSLSALRRFQSQPSWEQTGELIRKFLIEMIAAN